MVNLYRDKCSSCFSQQNWINSLRFFLLLTFSVEELHSFCEEETTLEPTKERSIYSYMAQNLFQSPEMWLRFCSRIDAFFGQVIEAFESKSLIELLEIWNGHLNGETSGSVNVLLWSILKRREQCPYRICGQLYLDCELLAARTLRERRSA